MPLHEALSRDRYFDLLPAPLWAVDAEDRTVDANPALVEALGYPLEELRGRSPIEFMTEESAATYRAQSILRRAHLVDSFSLTYRTRGGAERPFRVSCAPVLEDGRFVGKIAVLRDLAGGSAPESVRRMTPAPLETDPGARAAAWPGLSHDLRNALQTIVGFVAILGDETPGPLNAEQRKQLGMISTAAGDALAHLAAFDEPAKAPRAAEGPARKAPARTLRPKRRP